MACQNVRIGSREIAVERSPLHVNYLSCGIHEFTLTQLENGQIRLQQGRGVRVLGWVFCILGLPILILGLLATIGVLIQPALDNLLGTLFFLSFGFAFAFFGVKLLGRRCRFDTHAGELTIRHLARTRRRPLADILAVQVLNAGLFGSNNSEGDERFVSFQLNLVLDDPNEPRLFVAFHRAKMEMGEKAKQLAEFLGVPLLMSPRMQISLEQNQDSIPPKLPSDLMQTWTKTNAPMPVFDLEAGALGGLRLGDGLEKAEFLGRPDIDDQTADPRRMCLDYAGRGFQIVFEMGQFVELNCTIALHAADMAPEPGQGFSRPRLSSGIVLTPETSVDQVLQSFGPPETEENFVRGRALTYRKEWFTMEFEFERGTERLLDWSVMAHDD